MDGLLKNKIALVTGSSRGLGKAIARTLLEEGACVTITGSDRKNVEETFLEFNSVFEKERVHSFVGDLTTEEGTEQCAEHLFKKYGAVDLLVANLGSGSGGTEWNVTENEWSRLWQLNFEGSRRITNRIVPQMIKRKSGSVLYISSIAGQEVVGAPVPYSVAKASLIAYCKNLAWQLGRYQIRVNVICPGNIYFAGGVWEKKTLSDSSGVQEMLETKVPLRRFATPEEIANVVAFVSSERASFMTGSCVVVDGGQSTAI